MISIIVATDPNGVIGKGNTIPWNLPEDLKLFKKRTTDQSVVMGRLTWQSLPKKPLPNRVNYVVSRNPAPCTGHRCLEDTLAGPIWCHSLEEALSDARKNTRADGHPKDIYIIGGEQIYNLALQMGIVERIILSRVNDCYEGDHYFHVPSEWEPVEAESHDGFTVVYYVKR